MVAANWHATTKQVTFPIEPLFDPSGKFVGFTMRRVGQQTPIHNLSSPTSRKTLFPQANFPFLLRTALNISRAVASVHQTGCVVGDINQSGFLVGTDARTTLIDSDSFQVQAVGKLFPCTVATPEFTAPELHGKRLDQTLRTPNHDSFGLAILVFQLLFMGRYPFSGRFQGKGEMPNERAIKEFRFAYSSRTHETKMLPPPNVPLLEDIPSSLGDSFEISFGEIGANKGRPSAEDWVRVLESVENDVVKCTKSNGHHYFRNARSCPWCRMEQAFPGFFAFVPPIFSTSSTPINVAQLIASIRQVPDPGKAPDLASIMPNFQGSPSKLTPYAAWTERYIASLIGAFGGAVALQFEVTWFLGFLALAGSLIVGFRERHDPSPAGKILVQTRGVWQGLEAKWRQVADNSTFLQSRNDAEGIARRLQGSSTEEADRLAGLKTKQRDLQLKRFLERFYIAHAKIKGIGDTRKITLRSFGVETAADVERHNIEQINGFGPANVKALVEWRTSIERKFTFDPSEPINPADVAAIKSDIARMKADLEKRLRQAVSTLQTISADARNTRAALQNAALAAWRPLKQAECDVRGAMGTIVPLRIAGFAIAIFVAFVATSVFGPASNRVDRGGASTSQGGSAVVLPPAHATPPVNNQSANVPIQLPKDSNTTTTRTTIPAPPPWPPQTEIKPIPRSGSDGADKGSSFQPSLNMPLPPPDISSSSNQGGPSVPAPSPVRSTLRSADVRWIQSRLRTLDYLAIEPNGIWDAASRDALKDFKIIHHLQNNDVWDEPTEEKISSDKVVAASSTFIGEWSSFPNCAGEILLSINTRAARSSGGAVCEFQSFDVDGPGWQSSAICKAGDKVWNAKVKMNVRDGQLTWSSEMGTDRFTRCP
jgi:DNA-binding helix-hairpin-helix protein with protein kinase domain